MKKIKLLFIILFPILSYGNIIYIDHNDNVYPLSSISDSIDINGDGIMDIRLYRNISNLATTCNGSTSSSVRSGFFSGLGQNKVNSTTALSIDCFGDTLNIFDTWNNSAKIYYGINFPNGLCNNVGIGNHKQGFRLLINSSYCYGYIDYTLTNEGDVVIHGWYYENNPNVTIVANTNLDYPYNGDCVVYDTLFHYDTIVVYDTIYTNISVTDTLIINTSLVGVNSNTFNQIKIFPNPTSTYIFIDNGDYQLMDGYSIKITSSGGEVIFEELITQQQSYINISSWGNLGVYYISLINNLGVITDTHKILLE